MWIKKFFLKKFEMRDDQRLSMNQDYFFLFRALEISLDQRF